MQTVTIILAVILALVVIHDLHTSHLLNRTREKYYVSNQSLKTAMNIIKEES